jgi:hypothetical protein
MHVDPPRSLTLKATVARPHSSSCSSGASENLNIQITQSHTLTHPVRRATRSPSELPGRIRPTLFSSLPLDTSMSVRYQDRTRFATQDARDVRSTSQDTRPRMGAGCTDGSLIGQEAYGGRYVAAQASRRHVSVDSQFEDTQVWQARSDPAMEQDRLGIACV